MSCCGTCWLRDRALTFLAEEVYFGKARDVVGELRSMDIFILLFRYGS